MPTCAALAAFKAADGREESGAGMTRVGWFDFVGFCSNGAIIAMNCRGLGVLEVADGSGAVGGWVGVGGVEGGGEEGLIEHCTAVAREIPLVGFYLQPAVGGIVLPDSFWRRFAAIENVVAIKIAPFNRYRTLDV